MSVHCTCWLLMLALLCAVVTVAARCAETSDGNEFRKDYTFSQEAAGWLKLHRVPLPWHTARLQCYHEGAVLASPLNADLWRALSKFLAQAELDSDTHVFSGVSATLIDRVFLSVEGVALEQLYVQWDKSQPNNLDGDEDCVTYKKHGGMLTVHDMSCTKMLPYICYRPASSSDKLTECGTVDEGYKLEAGTGHCYKFHVRSTTWPMAARICHAEGGYLAVVDSDYEARLLAELIAANPTPLYTDLRDEALVGFKKWGNDDSWWTIHGKLLEDSGYSRWSEGQPNNLEGMQACGSILGDGQLNDAWCGKPVAFICEKSPDSLTRDSA